MPHDFHDHARKIVIREKWNEPVLRWLSAQWNAKYFYFGLPGPDAIDLRKWRDMIRRIIAFECDSDDLSNPRRNFIKLNRQLELLGIQYSLYYGPLEEVILRGLDYERKAFACDELVTLYNLDFCGSITERIVVEARLKCLRFEALRKIAALQRELYLQTGQDRFLLLLTMREDFYMPTLMKRLRDKDLPASTKEFLTRAGQPRIIERCIARNTELLKAFVFTLVRSTFGGHGITSTFLPPVAYMGSSAASPMMHFSVICRMASTETPHPLEQQAAGDFFQLRTLKATDGSIVPLGDNLHGRRIETNPTGFLRGLAF